MPNTAGQRGFFTTALTFFFFFFCTCCPKFQKELGLKCNYSLLYPSGVSLNPIIVYCANQKEMDYWFGLLKDNIEVNGGTAIAPETHTRMRVSLRIHMKEVQLHIPLHAASLRQVTGTLDWISSINSCTCSSACCDKFKSLFLHSSQRGCFIIHQAD